MRPGLELLTGILVLVNSAKDRYDLLLGRQRDGTRNAGTGTARRLHDLLCCLIHQLVVVSLDTNTDFFFDCH